MPEPERKPPLPPARSGGRSDAGGSFCASSNSDEIVLIVVAVDVVVVIFDVVVDNMIIAVAAAEADELFFNFSTSWRTCICSMQLTALSSEYPFTLKTLGILSRPVGSGLCSHATKRSAAFLARASAPFFCFPEDIKIEMYGQYLEEDRYLRAMQSSRKRNNRQRATLSDLAPRALRNRMRG